MTPNHALFRRLFAISKDKLDTYDHLPDAQAKYPFAYIGESNGSETPNNDLLGSVRQTVHLYGLRTDRGILDDVSAFLQTKAKLIRDGYEYHLAHTGTDKRTIPDNTDVQPLLHVVLDFTFDYTKKEA